MKGRRLIYAGTIALLAGCAPQLRADSGLAEPSGSRNVCSLLLSSLLADTTDLIMLKGIPASSEVSDVTVTPGINADRENPLTPEELGSLLDTATPVSPTDERIRAFHYAPWYEVSFVGPEGEYRMRLFLGGLGFLQLPDGNVGVFSFLHPE
jgi:hypothetical protein